MVAVVPALEDPPVVDAVDALGGDVQRDLEGLVCGEVASSCACCVCCVCCVLVLSLSSQILYGDSGISGIGAQ